MTSSASPARAASTGAGRDPMAVVARRSPPSPAAHAPSNGPGAKTRKGASPEPLCSGHEGLGPEGRQRALQPARREVGRRTKWPEASSFEAHASLARSVATCSRSSPTVPQTRVIAALRGTPVDSDGALGESRLDAARVDVHGWRAPAWRPRSPPPRARSPGAGRPLRAAARRLSKRSSGTTSAMAGPSGGAREQLGRARVDDPDRPAAGTRSTSGVELERGIGVCAGAGGRLRATQAAVAANAPMSASASRRPPRRPAGVICHADAREAAVLRADPHQVLAIGLEARLRVGRRSRRPPRRLPARPGGAPRSEDAARFACLSAHASSATPPGAATVTPGTSSGTASPEYTRPNSRAACSAASAPWKRSTSSRAKSALISIGLRPAAWSRLSASISPLLRRREQLEEPEDDVVADLHRLPEHRLGRLLDADVVVGALAHLLADDDAVLDARVRPLEDGRRHDDLRALAVLAHQVAADEEVEELVGPPELHVALERDRVVALQERVEELVLVDGAALVEALRRSPCARACARRSSWP